MTEIQKNPLAKNFDAISLIRFAFPSMVMMLFMGLGASKVLFPYCREYLTVQLIFVVGNMMQVLYQNLFVMAGKPTLGLVFAVLVGIANIVFDYVFIVLQQMGIKGAAIGTGIGYMIPTIIGTIFF